MGLYKRGKVWWMSFVYHGKPMRRSTEMTQRRQAENLLAKVKVDIVESRYFDAPKDQDRTVAEMMERYIRDRVSQHAPTGVRRARAALAHLLPFFGERTLSEITPALLANYKTRRRIEKAAPATINKELGLLKAAFNLAIREWEWCRENPMHRVRMEKVNNERVRYFSDGEFERLLAACPNWLIPIVLVARFTGLRRENIVTLRWRKVDLTRKIILMDQTKNGDRLGIPLCEQLVQVFQSLGRVRHLHSSYVFARSTGEPYSGNAVGMAFRRACKQAGIDDFRFHDLRHDFASTLVQRGADLYRVQRLLGHRDARMTQRYAHLAPENLREAVRLLDEDFHNFFTLDARQCGQLALSG